MAFSPDSGPVDPDELSARLVRAARVLASETGSAAFTVAQVAERAGVSLKAFYRTFRGKDELLLALIEDDSRRGAEVLEARVSDLRGYVLELFSMMMREPGAAGYAGVLAREHRRLSEHHPDELDEALEPLTSLLASFTRTADPKRDAHTTFGVLIAGVNDVLSGRVDDADELAEYLYAFCAHGLEAR